jgi:hypothetical protein
MNTRDIKYKRPYRSVSSGIYAQLSIYSKNSDESSMFKLLDTFNGINHDPVVEGVFKTATPEQLRYIAQKYKHRNNMTTRSIANVMFREHCEGKDVDRYISVVTKNKLLMIDSIRKADNELVAKMVSHLGAEELIHVINFMCSNKDEHMKQFFLIDVILPAIKNLVLEKQSDMISTLYETDIFLFASLLITLISRRDQQFVTLFVSCIHDTNDDALHYVITECGEIDYDTLCNVLVSLKTTNNFHLIKCIMHYITSPNFDKYEFFSCLCNYVYKREARYIIRYIFMEMVKMNDVETVFMMEIKFIFLQLVRFFTMCRSDGKRFSTQISAIKKFHRMFYHVLHDEIIEPSMLQSYNFTNRKTLNYFCDVVNIFFLKQHPKWHMISSCMKTMFCFKKYFKTLSQMNNNSDNESVRVLREIVSYQETNLPLPKHKRSSESDISQCPICMLVDTNCCLDCGHSFCYECINTWGETNNQCPTCRTMFHSCNV